MKVSVLLSSISIGTLEISYIVLKKKGYDVIWCKEQRVSRFSFYFLTFTYLWYQPLLLVQISWPLHSDNMFIYSANGFFECLGCTKHYTKYRGSVQFSSVASDSLRPHESQHARPRGPSPTPGVHSNSCPSSRWCHPAISSSVVPFSSCPQSLPASGSFPMSQLFAWGDQSIVCPCEFFF